MSDQERLPGSDPVAERASVGAGPLCVLRGGGDLATGVAWRLTRAGWPVVVLELPEPLTVRRTVALSTAVTDGEISVEGMRGVLVETAEEAVSLARSLAGRGGAAVLVASQLGALVSTPPDVVVDARLAKRNIDTTIDDAGIVVGLGPGFTVGRDCDAVVETMRGHDLGRVIWSGSAQPDTGTPAELGGRSASRVLRARAEGQVVWHAGIADVVVEGQPLGAVGDAVVAAPFDGVLRGAIRPGIKVPAGLKIGDVDPRCDPSACWEISDKALAVGGGVLEAILARRCGLA